MITSLHQFIYTTSIHASFVVIKLFLFLFFSAVSFLFQNFQRFRICGWAEMVLPRGDIKRMLGSIKNFNLDMTNHLSYEWNFHFSEWHTFHMAPSETACTQDLQINWYLYYLHVFLASKSIETGTFPLIANLVMAVTMDWCTAIS